MNAGRFVCTAILAGRCVITVPNLVPRTIRTLVRRHRQEDRRGLCERSRAAVNEVVRNRLPAIDTPTTMHLYKKSIA